MNELTREATKRVLQSENNNLFQVMARVRKNIQIFTEDSFMDRDTLLQHEIDSCDAQIDQCLRRIEQEIARATLLAQEREKLRLRQSRKGRYVSAVA